jgi:enoyl-CoA hydratase/carnithine racemase
MNAPLPANARDLSAVQAELIAALAPLVPDEALLWEREDTTPYECDGLAAYRQVPLAVVLPDTEAQVVEILRICHRLGVPVVPRGAGTSLSGGAMPTPGGLVLSLAKFKRILKLDPYTRTAVVQPGVRNLAISEAANPHGLYYAPDPSSQIACTIGGNVNENSGGVHCLKYGLTVHNVLRVRAVMMDGEVVEFGSEAPDAPGLDLLATVIGSEGMLAVVTEVTVRLIPKPQLAQVIMASFDNVETGGNAVADVIAAGIIPAGLEMMDKPATAAVEEFVCAGYDLDWGTKAEDAAQRAMSGQWDPVLDYRMMSRNVRAFMSLWESPKPVIAQVHGWCVGGGTDMVLCSDLIYMAEDAHIGYPPARVWGEPTTVMWVYRLGLEHAKRLMLTGEALSGTEAARLGLASKAVPADELAGVVDEMARKLTTIPLSQLVMSKLLVNQAYENMGLRSSQLIGTLLDGAARHTPEGIAWRDLAMKEGFREAVRRRDAPWGDYGERKRKS